MDLVYASLMRRSPAGALRVGEAAEVVGALWAHATPGDGLEHACARSEFDRIDLLIFLLAQGPEAPAECSATQRVDVLLARCHRASPLLHRHFVAPDSAPGH
ncbi:hypothetical protein [Kitasatospora azatica]|uniref:hypothetical protein n=1 Tax=Kitasatospora azatica TaxID=58347 RepID=UPI00055F5731|nr:hypothetical protein [Kitasatospora azatica]